MKQVQLKEHEIIVGIPLPWAVYGQDGELLLEKGQSLDSERQKYILITRGLFREPSPEEAKTLRLREKFSLSSPFNVLDAIRLNVTRILTDMNHARPSDYTKRVIRVATVVQKLCIEDADAALGAMMLDQNAPYTQVHPVMCSILTELLLRRKYIPEEDRLLYIAAALTQNIGMLELQELLNKQKEPLTEKQKQAIKKHPLVSREILQSLGIDHPEWLDTIQNHHERPDGKGYPYGLRDDKISAFARTLSLTDIYSAMILPRQYRDGYHVKRALREIFMQRGGVVDKELAQLLIQEFGAYPPGTYVQLSNGDIAIVIRRGIEEVNSPLVLSVLTGKGDQYSPPQKRDTGNAENFSILKVIPKVANLELDRHEIWGLGKS